MNRLVQHCCNRVRRLLAGPRGPGRLSRRLYPAVELLEDRAVPATFNVNSLADLSIAAGVNPATGAIAGLGNTVTLRSAIDAANHTPGGNTIRLMMPGTYHVALAGANTGSDATGAFAVLPGGGNLSILNVSGGAITIDGNHLDRVFDVNPTFDAANATPAFTVTLQGFAITGGVASAGDGAAGSGGGIRDTGNASLTLNNVIVTNNIARADGGGIAMENTVSTPWTLKVNNSTISNNHAGDAGGGIDTDGSGKVFINAGTVITGNTCVNQGAGIWLDAIGGTVSSVTVTNPGTATFGPILGFPVVHFTSVDGNGSGAEGSIIVDGNGTPIGVNVTNPGTGYDMPPTVSFSFRFFNPDITAVAKIVPMASATLTVTGATITNNDALTGPGGGIGNAGGSTVTILNSTVANNASGAAGGGFADENNLGTLIVANSLFLNNTAVGDGGAIQEAGPTTSITSSQIAGNASGGRGGAVFAGGTTLFVQTSTIANNTAGGDAQTGQGGGGIELQTTGTGLAASTIVDTTIVGNRALNARVFGGGIDGLVFSADLVLLNDTINANFAAVGGGIAWEGKNNAGSMLVQNTILAGNFSPLGRDALNAIRHFTDLGGNVIGVAGDFNAGFTGDTTRTGSLAAPLNPSLAPLGNYGGPVIGAPGSGQVLQTEALQLGSPAVGQGTVLRAPAYDERGFAHLANSAINAGAVSAVVPAIATASRPAKPVTQAQQKMVNGVPTTVFSVNSTADMHSPAVGTLTLRAAIDLANQTQGDKVIQLMVPGVYQITLPGGNSGTNASGGFAILPSGGNVTIVNASGGAITVDGNHLDRVFDVNPANDVNINDEYAVTLQGFTITGGMAVTGDGAADSGGGIRDQGIASLTLINMTVTGNVASGDGGGIAMENSISTPWKLTVNNSTISNNHAGDAGGGIDTDGSGRVFLNAGTVITGNTCVNQGAGIWLDAIADPNNADVLQSAALTVTGTIITNNAALTGPGGGIGNAGNGAVTIASSTIAHNFAGGNGGGFGDENNQGSLTIANSAILNNTSAGEGGGIQEGGPATTITSSEIAGNASGGPGGGIFADGIRLSVLSSTIANNVAGGNGDTNQGGAGIELQAVVATTITNSTIAGNRAVNAGGVNGGGIDAGLAYRGNLSLLQDTINANFGANGGGIFWAAFGGSSVLVQNTIIAQDFVAADGIGVDADGTGGPFMDGGGNLIGVAGDGNLGFGAASTQTGSLAHPLNALLGPLGNYGGPFIGAPGAGLFLDMEALLPGSPARVKGTKVGATK